MSDEMQRTERDRDEENAATGEGSSREAGLTVRADEPEPDPSVGAEVEELRAELEMLNDRHLRLAAEFDNYRKRNERDRRSLAARLQLDLVSALLDVLDDLERVADAESDSDEPVLEGVRLVEKKLRSILEAAGLEPLEAEGARFDPEVMEALMTVPTEDPSLDDHVADVFQRGYHFRDVLVRPAKVRVLKHEPRSEDAR